LWWWTRTPGGNADDYQNKRVPGKAICKTMKTKGEQTGLLRSRAAVEEYATLDVLAKEFEFA